MKLATVHQDGFGAEHFGDFGEDRGAALGYDPVGEDAQERVGRYAGKAVGTAAFKADTQLAHRYFHPAVLGCGGEDFAQLLKAVFDLVAHFLAGEHAHAGGLNGADEFAESVELVVFAAEADDEHAAGVGMMDHVGEDATGVFMVVAKLGAAVVVGECDDGVDGTFATGDFGLETADNLLADAVDAAHGGDDPYLVADAHLTVATAETHERAADRRRGDFHQRGVVTIVQKAFQIGFYAGMVDLRAGRRIACQMPYREPVFNYVFSLTRVLEKDLMTAGDVFQEGDTKDIFAFGKVLQGDGYIVVGVDLDEFHLRMAL